jgi:hypothetical protein
MLLICQGRQRLKCDGTRAETRFRLSAKRTSPFKSAGASVQSTIGSRRVCISCSNVGYTVFRGSVKVTGYPLYLPVSPSLTFPCVTVCHQVSTGLCYAEHLEVLTFSVPYIILRLHNNYLWCLSLQWIFKGSFKWYWKIPAAENFWSSWNAGSLRSSSGQNVS